MKVLVAVESEYFAKEQAKFTIDHAWLKDLVFKVIHIVEPVKLDTDELDSGKFTNEFANMKLERGRKLVKETAQRIEESFPEATITEQVETGNTKEKLLETIEEWQADVAIVGSHGRREIERYAIGSISSEILAYAKCSVIVVRPYAQYKPAS